MPILVMYEGHIHRRSKKNNEVQIIAFDQYIFDLSRFGSSKGKKIHYKTYESYIGELITPDPENHYFKHRPGRFWAELHDRLSNPLYPILFVLVAIAMLGFPRTTREDRMKNVVIALVMASGARLGGLLSVNVLSKNEAAIFLVYGIPVCGILLAIYIIQTRGAGSGLKGKLQKMGKKSIEGAGVMKTLSRYILRKFTISIISVFVLCLCLIFLIDLIEMMRITLKKNGTVFDAMYISLLRVPSFAELSMPFAVLIGSIGSFLVLSKNSELIIARSSGMSVWQFIRPALYVGGTYRHTGFDRL